MNKKTIKPFADILIHYLDLAYGGLRSDMKQEIENAVYGFANAIIYECAAEQEPLSQAETDRRLALEYGLEHGNQAF